MPDKNQGDTNNLPDKKRFKRFNNVIRLILVSTALILTGCVDRPSTNDPAKNIPTRVPPTSAPVQFGPNSSIWGLGFVQKRNSSDITEYYNPSKLNPEDALNVNSNCIYTDTLKLEIYGDNSASYPIVKRAQLVLEDSGNKYSTDITIDNRAGDGISSKNLAKAVRKLEDRYNDYSGTASEAVNRSTEIDPSTGVFTTSGKVIVVVNLCGNITVNTPNPGKNK